MGLLQRTVVQGAGDKLIRPYREILLTSLLTIGQVAYPIIPKDREEALGNLLGIAFPLGYKALILGSLSQVQRIADCIVPQGIDLHYISGSFQNRLACYGAVHPSKRTVIALIIDQFVLLHGHLGEGTPLAIGFQDLGEGMGIFLPKHGLGYLRPTFILLECPEKP